MPDDDKITEEVIAPHSIRAKLNFTLLDMLLTFNLCVK